MRYSETETERQRETHRETQRETGRWTFVNFFIYHLRPSERERNRDRQAETDRDALSDIVQISFNSRQF